MGTGIMEINIPAGASEVLLKTAGKYCDKDIRVRDLSGFKIISGTVTLDADITGTSQVSYTVPCPPGAKIVMFEADEATYDSIPSTGTYMVGFHANFADDITGSQKNALQTVKNSGTMAGTGSVATMGDNGCTIGCYPVKAGTYHWTAYYWNE